MLLWWIKVYVTGKARHVTLFVALGSASASSSAVISLGELHRCSGVLPSLSATFGLAPPAMSAIISSDDLAVWRGDRSTYGWGGESNGSVALKIGYCVAHGGDVGVGDGGGGRRCC